MVIRKPNLVTELFVVATHDVPGLHYNPSCAGMHHSLDVFPMSTLRRRRVL